jgi:hypothetical protein
MVENRRQHHALERPGIAAFLKSKGRGDEMKKEKTITGFKAYNKGMVCRGFQYKVGKTYECETAKICNSGFHFCQNPLDVLNYYNLCESDFSEAKSLGKTQKHDTNSQVCTTKIKIGAKLSLPAFIKASIDFLLTKTTDNKTKAASRHYSQLAASRHSSQLAASGYYSQLAASGNFSKLVASGNFSKLVASGDSSQLAASGDSSQLAASGYYSQLAASGNFSKLVASGNSNKLEINGSDSVGAAIGVGCVIKGTIGSWITLSEWKYDEKKQRNIPVCVKSTQIDGKKIKADTFYKLKNGKFVAVE